MFVPSADCVQLTPAHRRVDTFVTFPFCAQADTPRPRCAFKKYFTEEVLIGTSDGLTLMDDGADQPHSLEEIAVRNN